MDRIVRLEPAPAPANTPPSLVVGDGPVRSGILKAQARRLAWLKGVTFTGVIIHRDQVPAHVAASTWPCNRHKSPPGRLAPEAMEYLVLGARPSSPRPRPTCKKCFTDNERLAVQRNRGRRVEALTACATTPPCASVWPARLSADHRPSTTWLGNARKAVALIT